MFTSSATVTEWPYNPGLESVCACWTCLLGTTMWQNIVEKPPLSTDPSVQILYWLAYILWGLFYLWCYYRKSFAQIGWRRKVNYVSEWSNHRRNSRKGVSASGKTEEKWSPVHNVFSNSLILSSLKSWLKSAVSSNHDPLRIFSPIVLQMFRQLKHFTDAPIWTLMPWALKKLAVTWCTLLNAQGLRHGKGEGGSTEICDHPSDGAHRCHIGKFHWYVVEERCYSWLRYVGTECNPADVASRCFKVAAWNRGVGGPVNPVCQLPSEVSVLSEASSISGLLYVVVI